MIRFQVKAGDPETSRLVASKNGSFFFRFTVKQMNKFSQKQALIHPRKQTFCTWKYPQTEKRKHRSKTTKFGVPAVRFFGGCKSISLSNFASLISLWHSIWAVLCFDLCLRLRFWRAVGIPPTKKEIWNTTDWWPVWLYHNLRPIIITNL